MVELEGGATAQIFASWCTPGAQGRPGDLPCRRGPGGRGLRPHPLLRSGSGCDALAGLEPRRAADHRLLRRLARIRRRGALRQRFQDRVGDVHPLAVRRRRFLLDPAGGGEGRPARRVRDAELGRGEAGSTSRRWRADRAAPGPADPGRRHRALRHGRRARGRPGAGAALQPRRLRGGARRGRSARRRRPAARRADRLGRRRWPFAATSGGSGSASPKRWTPPSAAWGSTGPPRAS